MQNIEKHKTRKVEEVNDEIMKWEAQIYIIDRELTQNTNIYSAAELNNFSLIKNNLVETIAQLKSQLANDEKKIEI